MSHQLTSEQSAIVSAYRDRLALVVEAGAGSGKTSTLRACAEADGRSATYIAYNRAIKEDAAGRFPGHVQCATAHGLAYRAIGHRYRARLNSARLSARQVAAELGLSRVEPLRIELGTDRGVAVLDPVKLAREATAAVASFCQSARDEVGEEDVRRIARLEEEPHHRVVVAAVLPIARRLWADVASTDGRLPFTHDHYLKIWQLSRPRIESEAILLDEAQDANPVIEAIVSAQDHAQRVLVGDQCQQLYAWRGAVDAMARFPADRRLLLSQSFRFGPAVAAEANVWLDRLGATLRIRGFDQVPSTVGQVDRPDAILCRTNAGAFAEVMRLIDADLAVALVGGGSAIEALARAAIDLQNGAPCSHPDLAAFASWGEVERYAEEDEGGADLLPFVRLVKDHGAPKLLRLAGRLSDERSADVTVSTAHRSKGREWDRVRIGPDFRKPRGGVEPPRSELMLAYVAVTRAKLELELGGLSWGRDTDESEDA